VGTADSTLLRKVAGYSLSSPALWTLSSLCKVCSIKFKDHVSSPELQPVFNRNVSIKGPSYWKTQRDKNVDFPVPFTVDAQQMLGLSLDGKRDGVVCALLTAAILAGEVVVNPQFVLQHRPRTGNGGELRAETQACCVLQTRF